MAFRPSLLLHLLASVRRACPPGVAVLVAFAIGACMRASNLPPQTPHAPLLAAASVAHKDEPFSIAFVTPAGAIAVHAELGLVFSRPLKALGQAGQVVDLPLSLSPAVPGTWHWLGSQAVYFVPSRSHLPYATELSLTIGGQLQALDGSRLGAETRVTWQTPVPTLEQVQAVATVRTVAAGSDEVIVPSSTLRVSVNQPVKLATLRSHLVLEERVGDKSESLAFSLSPEPRATDTFLLTPRRAFRLNASVELRVSSGLRGLEGERLGTTQQFQFKTPQPLAVVSIDCERGPAYGGDCSPFGSINLVLNNPVTAGALRRSLRVSSGASVPTYYESLDAVENVSLDGRLSAGQRISLSVAAGLKDVFGQSLKKTVKAELRVGHFPARAELGLSGEVLELSSRSTLPVGAVNLSSASLVSAPLPPERLGEFLAPIEQDSFAKAASLPAARRQPMTVAGPQDRLVAGEYSLGFEANRPGLRLVALSYATINDEGKPEQVTDHRLVQRTALGLSAHVGRYGAVAWVTELATGRSVAGAEVKLVLGKGAARTLGVTDQDGLWRAGADVFAPELLTDYEHHPAALLVQRGDDVTFRRLNALENSYRYDAPFAVGSPLETRWLLVTERAIYRPGEGIDIVALGRSELATGSAIPVGKSVTLSLLGAEGEVLSKSTGKVSEFGSVSAHLVIPRSTRPGELTVQLKPSEPIGEASTSIRVAEYRPVELEAELRVERSDALMGDEVAAMVEGRMLYGGPAADAKVSLSSYAQRASYAPPGTEGYETSEQEDTYDSSSRVVTSSEETLSAVGQLLLSLKTQALAKGHPEWLVTEAEVSDLSRQPVMASSRLLVHPAEAYVGLKLKSSSFVPVGSAFAVEVAAFAARTGQRMSEPVSVELVQRRWVVAYERAGRGLHGDYHEELKRLGGCNVQTDATDRTCQFTVREAGEYLIRAVLKDAKGRSAKASLQLYASGAGNPIWRESERETLELVPDRASYKPGDTAKILVRSPFPEANALVTVERAGLLWSQQLHLVGGAPVLSIPITEQTRPNAYVSVHLVRGRTRPAPRSGEHPDLGAPSYRVGYAELKLDSSAQRLKVAVEPSAREAAPGQTIDVTATVTDVAGAPAAAEVTLWAVDEGVLALANYSVPDPIAAFHGARQLRLGPLDTRDDLSAFSLNSLRELIGASKGAEGGGGGEGPGGGSARSDFRSTAFFVPHLVTDARGQVRAKLRLPDGVTSYKVFALAGSKASQFGQGTERITTSRPLMGRPMLPRLLRVGDEARAGVIVAGRDLGAADVDVALTSDGLESREKSARVHLAAGKTAEALFSLRAVRAGSAKLRFDLHSGVYRDAVVVERPVLLPQPEEVSAISGETRVKVLEQLGSFDALRPELSQLTVSLSSTALAGVEAAFGQLTTYPHACSEQLSSRLMALVPLEALAKAVGRESPKASKALAESTIAELLARQRSSGGLVMWEGLSEESVWATTYALYALTLAKQQGFAVDSARLERAKSYLHSHLGEFVHEPTTPSELERMASSPFVLQVLASVGAADPGGMSRVFERRERLPWFARAQLALAYAETGHDAQSLDTLMRELEVYLRNDGQTARFVFPVGERFSRLFDSELRSSALGLWALARARPKHPMLPALARGLLAQRHGGTWGTTQESTFALLALDAYRRARETASGTVSGRLSLGARELLAGVFGNTGPIARRVTLPLTQFASSDVGLTIESRNAETLFYELRLRYVPRAPAATPLDAGFSLRRAWNLATPAQLSQPGPVAVESSLVEVPVGQTLVVDLLVVSPKPRDFVVLEDPLPAGLEAIDTQLATTSTAARLGSALKGEMSGVHREVHDERVVFLIDHLPPGMHHFRYLARSIVRGRFGTPPAKVEAMYQPEVFGRTAAGNLQVN